jgi:glycosyltransferase 2 family protein
MRSKSFQLVQYVFLLFTGLGLCWLFFRNVDLGGLIDKLGTGNLSWFYLVMLVSIVVYCIRVLRWQMLIKAAGHKAGFLNTLSALSIGYFVNFAVPRLGEVTRCLSLRRSENIPFMQSLGTVIIERVVDVFSLILMLLLTLALQFDKLVAFMKAYVFSPLYHGIVLKVLQGNWLVISLLLGIGCLGLFLVYRFRRYIRDHSPKLILRFMQGFKDGLSSILKLEKKWLFLLYTGLIWLCYYLMTWFWFFVFPETSLLGWGACLAIVTIGTIGRSVPIQGGGMGAYHFLVTQVAILYGTTELLGKTLATLIHAGQTFFTFLMGLVGLIIFFLSYWKNRRN